MKQENSSTTPDGGSCPVCLGDKDNVLPQSARLWPGGTDEDWVRTRFSTPTTFEPHNPGTFNGLEVRTNTRTWVTKFNTPKFLLPGDTLSVKFDFGGCPGCDGSGKFNDYARRRILGQVPEMCLPDR